MKYNILGLILSVFLCHSFYAQVLLKNENIENNKFTLEFENNVLYRLYKKNGRKIIKFPGFQDPAKNGSFILPEKNLFISIPPNSKPSAKLILLSQKKINAIPEINPTVVLLNDSTLEYQKSDLLEISPKPIIENLGYLWIGDKYYINLKVKLFEYSNDGGTIKNSRFKVILNFKNNLNYKEKTGIIKNFDFSINSKYEFPYSYKIKKYTPKISDSWIDYTKSYLKLGVTKDAIYRITKNDLINYGISTSLINPKTFKLYLKGKEIPLYVNGENDSSFDDKDYIEFYGSKNYGDKDYRRIALFGQRYKEFIDRYSDTTAYWLTWNGDVGKRVDTLLSNQGVTSDTVDYYDQFLHFEKNLWYDFSLSGGEVRRQNPEIYENETWDWWGQGVGTKSFSFNVSNLKPGHTAKAYVKIQSWATNIFTNAHNLALKINANPNPLDSTFINKYQDITLSGSFQSDELVDGNNKLKLTSYATESNPNSCFGDWWEIEYPRKIIVNNDSLIFEYRNLSLPLFANIVISNFNATNFSLYKIFNTDQYQKITNYNHSGSTITFQDTIKNGIKYIIIESSKISKPKFDYKKQFVNLRSNSNRADYILITHPEFLNTAGEYSNFIQDNYNVTTKVINVFDIYDEFNYGFLAPEPIKDFLMMTQDNWQPPHPKFVFLVGKPTYDYHGYKTEYFGAPPQKNFVPSYGEPVSDVWYVIWDTTGAAIPQINIGRLPIQSNEEFQLYLLKHQNYLSQKYDAWNKRFLFLSGGNFNDTTQLNQLKSVNDFIIDNFVTPPPIGGISHHFYKTANPVTNFGPFSQEEIKKAIDDGGLFISYLGHSGTQTWDNSISQSNQLENTINRNPMITDFGCSTGKYAEPDVTSFSEQFTVQEKGQALTYVGNSSLGFLSTATTFPQIFYRKFLQDSVLNIGDAHRLAKIEMLNTYGASGVFSLFSMTNELIGDPIINLKLPTKPNLILENSTVDINPKLPSDTDDSTNIKIKYFNYGTVINDTIRIDIKDTFEGSQIAELSLSKPIPLYKDSLQFSLPTKNKAGLHSLGISIDPANIVDEIYDDDNSVSILFNVLSGSIKYLADFDVENEFKNTVKLLNPVKKPVNETFIIELSNSAEFLNSQKETLHFDTVYSKYIIPSEFNNKRVWVRAKLTTTDEYGKTISLFSGSNLGYLLNDSISFYQSKFVKSVFRNNNISLDSNNIDFKIISKGFLDGNTALILRNSQNFIPENTLRGQHICLFDSKTYKFIKYLMFDIRGKGPEETQSYINFLDTLSTDYIVAFAIASDAHVTDETLKSRIKNYGSIYIDSLAYLSSWAMLGWKNAIPGSVPEAYSKAGDGPAIVDSVILNIHKFGSLSTSNIGPASRWKKLSVSDSIPSDSKIDYRILGIKNNSEVDTLNYVTINNGEADLSFLNTQNYNFIKILAEFNASSDLISPVLKSLGVSYDGVPELGTNYQVVWLDSDTLEQGEDVNLSFYVYNVGASSADSFKIKVNLVKPDNSSQQIFEELVYSLGSEQRKLFTVKYNTFNYKGSGQFNINIDTDDKILELYEDNNFYSIPFFVKGDTTKPNLNITFDGNEIFDGEYISTKPDIKIELNDPSLVPINDTSAVSIFLNNEPVYYANNQDNLSINFSSSNPKVIVNYNPTLEKGEYTLTVFGKDASGNVADSAGITKNFLVDNETKLLNLYNYPNPFANETYFTFKLTQIPDEIKIKIYTIAGRLIKEIDVPRNKLNFDFNRIYWNGRDEDGDIIANGVYFYKVLMKTPNKTEQITQKLAIIR